MPDVITEVVDQSAPPEDYAQYEAWIDAQGKAPVDTPEITTPAAGDPPPPSEPVEASTEAEAGQIAEASEPTEPSTEQVIAENDPPADPADEPEKDTRLARRMRTLTGSNRELKESIAELTARLAALQEDEAGDEIPGEVASPPAVSADTSVPALKRPKLSDFEDTDAQTAFDQYEAAKDAYNDAKTAAQLTAAIESHKAELARQRADADFRVAKAAADAAWSQAASRYADFNEKLANPEVQVSPALEAVLRMDPASGTELAYYLAGHPEECKAIAEETLVRIDPAKFKRGSNAEQAEGQRQWNLAMARAGIKLGEIRAKLAAPPEPPAKPPVTAKVPTAVTPAKAPAAPPVPPPPTKKVSTAHPPPPQIRSSGVSPKLDVNSEEGATDYEKWEKAMEARDAVKNGRR